MSKVKASKVAHAVQIALLGTTAASLAPQTALGQDGAAPLEEIVVSGIRRSLTDAVNVKRTATGVVDAISSEDIGELPDENVAETLQRINGIQIQRRNGEGSRVNVRGLVQNRLEVDGATLVSPLGRSYTGFDESVFPVLQFVPSDLLSGVQVYKTSEANQVEGALGGTVNLTLHKPLDLGNTISVGAQLSYDDETEDTDPRLSGTISRTNADETFGGLLSVSQSTRSVGEQLFFSRTGWSMGATGFAAPGDFRLQNLEEDRDRTGILGSLQWAPNENTNLTFQAFHATYDIERDRSWFSAAGSGGTDPAAYLDTPVISPNNTILAGTYTSQIQGNGEHNEIDSETTNFSLTLDRTVGSWDFSARVTTGEAEQNERQDFIRVRQNGVTFFRDYTGSTPILNVTDGFDILDPALYDSASGLIGFSNDVLHENEETTFTVDATYNIDGGFVTSVDAGIRIADQEATRTWFHSGNAAGAGVWIVETPGGLTGNVDPALFEVWDLDVFGGGSSNVTQFLAGDPDGLGSTAALNAWVQANGRAGHGIFMQSARQTHGTQEDLAAAYVKLNFESEWGTVPVSGNIGLRWVDTDQTSDFFLLSATGTTPVTTSRSYDDVLPSLNIRFDLNDDVVLRFGASEVIARPDTTELRGSTSIDSLAGTASGGNTNLAPATATAFDVSLEWYLDDASVASIAVFTKDVDGFLSAQTAVETIEGGGTNQNVASPDFGTFNFLTSRSVAIGESSIDGVELAFQKAWDSGFGTQLNFTYVDSSGVEAAGGPAIPLEGLSETSYNIVGFYENDLFAARLAYNWREEFLVSRSFNGSPLFEEDRGQLDFSASYYVTDAITLSLEAINLNDERVDQYSEFTERKFRIEDTGRRFFFGVRASF